MSRLKLPVVIFREPVWEWNPDRGQCTLEMETDVVLMMSFEYWDPAMPKASFCH